MFVCDHQLLLEANKTVSFKEQVKTKNKYASLEYFFNLIGAIGYIIFQIFFAQCGIF